jgi:predicted ferric reductase
MTGQLAWFVARATGIVAWALVTASVIWGLLLSTRLLGRNPGTRWLLDLHRFLGALAVVFTAVHLGGLVADTYTSFGPQEILVPLAGNWKPRPVALGVTGLYLLVAIEITSLLMTRLPRRWWRAVHLTSYGLFWLATLHGVTAGTDTREPLLWLAYLLATGAVLFLTLIRVLSDRRRQLSTRAPTTAAPT